MSALCGHAGCGVDGIRDSSLDGEGVEDEQAWHRTVWMASTSHNAGVRVQRDRSARRNALVKGLEPVGCHRLGPADGGVSLCLFLPTAEGILG